MALDVSAWAQTVHNNDTIFAYNLGDYLGSGMTVETFMPGVKNKMFPRVINRTSTNAADGTTLAVNSNTDLGPTITTDVPHKLHEYVPYDLIADYGQIVPNSISTGLGNNLGEGRADRICAFIAKTAEDLGTYVPATGAGGRVYYDDELTGDSLADAIADGIFTILGAMDRAKVGKSNRVCLINPIEFYLLRKSQYFASADWTSQSDNSQMNNRFSAFGVEFINAPSIFGQDWSANTNVPTKYRENFATFKAVVWDKTAFAVHRTEQPSGTIDDTPEEDSWLVKAREIFGIGALQGNATGSCYVLQGDVA